MSGASAGVVSTKPCPDVGSDATPVRRVDPKAIPLTIDRDDAPAGLNRYSQAMRLRQKAVQHRSRAIRVGEQFAAGFLV
jgi:hypothetical protein